MTSAAVLTRPGQPFLEQRFHGGGQEAAIVLVAQLADRLRLRGIADFWINQQADTCRETARLISLSQEQPLSWWQRWMLWLHLSMCSLCRGFGRDVKLLRKAVRESAMRRDGTTAEGLSEESKRRLESLLSARDE